MHVELINLKKETDHTIFDEICRHNASLFGIFMFIVLIFPAYRSAAQRTDMLVLKNGDRITGDIKRMEKSVLTIRTNDMGSLSVDWSKVKSLKTKKTYEIRMSSGMVYYTSFDTTSRSGEIALVTQFEPEYESFYVNQMEIVRITRLKDIFWMRFSGNYSIGFGVIKADHLSKFNFNATTKYTAKKYLLELNLNSNRSRTEGTDPNINQNIKFKYSRFLRKRWAYGSSVNVEQNTELGLDLRALLALEAGIFIFQNNLHRLIVAGGVQGTREKTSDSNQKNNVEGILETQYDIYKFQHPKVNVSTSAVMYPSISDFGRFRSEININASVELFKDFFFTLGFYFKSDNKPAEDASSTDYNFNTALSYNL